MDYAKCWIFPDPVTYVLHVHAYIHVHTLRCMFYILMSLALFEDVDISHKVRHRVPLQLCYEKDKMLVTQQTENTYK